ncbi:MAG TPA: diaminopimelate epimerase, partial [Blastocatellia bacterium]
MTNFIKKTNFIKFQAMGNDFLIVMVEDVTRASETPDLARRMCSRAFGAGADGLILVDQKGDQNGGQGARFSSRVFNSDGSEAEISGNGTRCVAAYLIWSGLASGPDLDVGTAAGIKHCALISRDGPRFEFRIDMGTPELRSDRIPVTMEPPAESVVDQELDVNGEQVRFTAASMGNPHCCLFVDDLSDAIFSRLGPAIESHPRFPNHTNVEFIRPISHSEIEIRIWERGAGPTLSSGTGSCASVVASVLNRKTSRRVRVHTAGGILEVFWADDGHIWLTASAEAVYRGQWLLD